MAGMVICGPSLGTHSRGRWQGGGGGRKCGMYTESSKTSSGLTPAITGCLQAAHDVTGELAKARAGRISVSQDKLAFEESQIRRCPQQGCQMGLCIQHDRLSVNVPVARVEGSADCWFGWFCGLGWLRRLGGSDLRFDAVQFGVLQVPPDFRLFWACALFTLVCFGFCLMLCTRSVAWFVRRLR